MTVFLATEGFLLSKLAEGRSHHTINDYRRCLTRFAQWLGDDRDVASVTTDDVRRFMAHLRASGIGIKTVRNYHVALSSFWTWLGQEFGIPHVMRGVARPKVNPPTWDLPTRDDILRMLKACEYTQEAETFARRTFRMRRPTALRDKCIILVFVDTGIRVSELCRLTLGDVDLEDGSVLVRYGKGRKQRMVFIGKQTTRLLWRYIRQYRRDARPDEPLFLNNYGHEFTRAGISRLVHRIGERAGVRVWPHLLRHVFATEFLRNGGSIFHLKRLLGHSSNDMVERYAQIVGADLKRVHEKASPADRWRL